MPQFHQEPAGAMYGTHSVHILDSWSAASLALGLFAAPAGLLVVVVAVGAALFAYSRNRRRRSLDAYRPPGALSDTEAAIAGIADESRAHTIQVLLISKLSSICIPYTNTNSNFVNSP